MAGAWFFAGRCGRGVVYTDRQYFGPPAYSICITGLLRGFSPIFGADLRHMEVGTRVLSPIMNNKTYGQFSPT